MTDLAARVLEGDTRAAARLCRLVDDRAPGYREALAALYAAPADAYVVGVTGSPGAGKSTLVDRLAAAYRARGGRVGVVAVDPTSPFSGGAILGDRVRMQRHFEDPDVFIRSLATRGALGGLSRSARDVVRVLAAWGARVVLLETVGVGQDELDVTRVAGTTVVVLAPGQGDDVQAIKAGILECADVLVVNKGDRPGADSTVRDLENMLSIAALSRAATVAPARHGGGHRAPGAPVDVEGWTPPIVKTTATADTGIPDLAAAIDRHREFSATPRGRELRAARVTALLSSWLREALAETIADELSGEIAGAARALAEGQGNPHEVVDDLVRRFRAVPPGARS